MLARIYASSASLAAPLLRVMLNRRALRGKEIAERLPERRGFSRTERPAGSLIWIHCASVGESVSVLSVVEALIPLIGDGHVLLTTGTVTSAEMLAGRLRDMGLAGRVSHRFAPLDVPAWIRRFLGHWRPDVAVFVESEIWPNLLAACRARSIPTALVNGRMSDKSFRRWRRTGGFAQSMFGGFRVVIAQSPEDADRLKALGAGMAAAEANLKFAALPLPVPPLELERLRALLLGRPIWLAASTHPGEEMIAFAVHEALRDRHPGLLTIVAPRHPDRGAEIAAIVGAPPMTRRGAREDPPRGAGVWLADTMGELGLFYSLAGMAFVGGSFVPAGGHNPLEPSRLGCAVAIGPHTANCADPAAALQAAGALTRVADPPALALWIDRLIRDDGARRRMGEAGRIASRQYADLPGRVAAIVAGLARSGEHR